MTERLTISRLGHRGDGIVDTPGGPVFVPYTLPGEIAEVEPFPGHPDRRHLLAVERASAERIAPVIWGNLAGSKVLLSRLPSPSHCAKVPMSLGFHPQCHSSRTSTTIHRAGAAVTVRC